MKKISETFLEFVDPILSLMPEEARKGDIENVLKIGFTVWNSVVYDTVNGNNEYLDRVRDLMAGDPASSAFIGMLIDRKRELFANDEWLIGDYRVTWRQGQLNLWAEARDPRSSTSQG